MSFSHRFFLISFMFIIFDVEISFMSPVPFSMVSDVGLWVFFCCCLMYEYIWGSLDWLG